MGIYRRFKMRFGGVKHDFVPILVRQTDFLCKSTALLAEIFASTDRDLWKRNEREIKSCEVQGDALLTDFHEMLSGRIMLKINKLDLQAVSMAMDDCIDAVKDTSKAVLIYQPDHIDTQLEELAKIAESQSLALREMVPLLEDIRKNVTAISHCCERVTELEHAADEDYEDYIGFIFNNVEDVRELIKYKNLAEMLENVTDVHKKISDRVRDLLLNYLTD
ncbi:MAG: DUF47 family protein [Bacteroidales bacterium]|nr:DUF47 family protein [Bacteroidales bacterium]